MAANSKIEWCDNTFNPWCGCVKVSPACDNCYAEADAKRCLHTRLPLWGKGSHRLMYSDKHWNHPVEWNKQAQRIGRHLRVFCASTADIMEDRPDLREPRRRLFRLVEETPNLDWLFLTKRPQNYMRFLPAEWRKNPRPNVWLMTTVETQEYIGRIEAMLKVPSVVYGVSCEPLLGPIKLPKDFLKLGSRAWVIAGGEGGRLVAKTRPTKPDWFSDLHNQCIRAHAAFFFKKWGNFVNYERHYMPRPPRKADPEYKSKYAEYERQLAIYKHDQRSLLGSVYEEFPTQAEHDFNAWREHMMYLAECA